MAGTDAATARQRQWVISAWKSAGLNAAQALALAETEEQRVTATVMGHYEGAPAGLPERGL